jgi:predicted CXXCH cytochrome family protein
MEQSAMNRFGSIMEKKRIHKIDIRSRKLQAFYVLLILLITFNAYALDYPHYEEKGISCESCHFVYGGLPSLLPAWTVHDPQDIDDSLYNTLCRGCHDDEEAPFMATHSSLQIDNSYGNWSIECRICHDPHSQRQFRTYGSASYLYSGEVAAVTGTTLTKTDDGVTWDTDEYQGLVLIPNALSSSRKKYGYKILDTTGNTITVEGPINTSKVLPGDTFVIIYGKLIRSSINLYDILAFIGASTDIRPDEPVPGQSLFVQDDAGWTDNAYQGLVLIPNMAEPNYSYMIFSNTEDTLTLQGSIDMTLVEIGDLFKILLGKTGSADVKFYDSTGTNSFADGDEIFDGVCEVCHSNTTHFRNDGTGETQNHENLGIDGKAGQDCINCHSHLAGFAHSAGGGGGGDGSGCSNAAGCHQDQDSHPTHLNLINLTIEEGACLTCHLEDDFPKFADDQLGRENTSVCDNCHSSDGAAIATDIMKDYWSNPGSSDGSPGSWLEGEGEESFCGSCHDETPGNSEKEGNGDDAPNIVGNKVTNGFFKTGHGKKTGSYTRLSWQGVTASGNPAANRSCTDCHDLTIQHFDSQNSRLKIGFHNDDDNSNCRQCHDPETVAVGEPQWYTTYADYQNSAHSTEKCSNCHDVHGVSGDPGMTKANQETLCYQCHTEGGVKNFGVAGYRGNHDGGDNSSSLINTSANFPTLNVNLVGWKVYNLTDGSSGTITAHDATAITAALSGGTENDWDNGDKYHITIVDDIQQAFSMSEKHNLGTLFSLGGSNYSLECISCHNVHTVTGKHWDAEENKTPITRFPPDKEEEGTLLNLQPWGDGAGEKMDDFAALGYGTGGFAYNIARGYQLGSSSLPFDQDAVYRPPKVGSGYDMEFSGDVLPDYTSLCLDCHTSRMSDANPPINWGQGIGCTDNSVDPPNQRIECGAQHGLGVAAKPSYMSDDGTAGFWGSSGNPDMLYQMNYVTRGRHNGHFMRWPYDSADRGAGINFVLSCTDCHEAHGASGSSMLRPVVNNYTPGTSIWNTFCNACHYYYGGQHAGMSCANASCHEAVSIHRIIHVTHSGGTQLMLTASGYEGNYERPTFTPDIISVEGYIGSDILTITFDSGVWSNIDLTGFLDKDDFWLFDAGGNNPRTIESITHVSGEATAIITMSEVMTEADLFTDTIAMKPASVWNWYEGGYVNYATGTIAAQAVSGGPWPVTITGPPPFNVQSVLYGGIQLKLNGIIADSNQIYVTFTEGAYSIIADDLQIGDFVLDCGGRSILSVTHTAGDSFAILTLDTIVDQSEVGVCTVAAAPDSIFDSYGTPAGSAAIALALPPEASVNDLVLRWSFNEASGVANSTDALGTQEDMHGVLTRNVVRVASTKPGAAAGDNSVKLDRDDIAGNDRGAVQLNYTVNPDDGFPPAIYRSGGAPVIVQEMQNTSEFSFSVWIKPTALGCAEGQTLGLNTKLRRDVLTTQFWIKNWALGIMRFSDDGDPLNGNCTTEDSTHDVLRFWVAVGDPTDMRCDAWGGSFCDSSVTPILPTNTQAHSFAQTETSASGALTYGVALQPGVWQHVVGTWDGRYIRIYIDAQLAAETDMGGTGNYVMVADPHLWGGDMVGDGSLYRHVSSFFAAGARPIFSSSGSPSGGAVYWSANGFYDLGNLTYVGELDDVKYWKIALPLATIQN